MIGKTISLMLKLYKTNMLDKIDTIFLFISSVQM